MDSCEPLPTFLWLHLVSSFELWREVVSVSIEVPSMLTQTTTSQQPHNNPEVDEHSLFTERSEARATLVSYYDRINTVVEPDPTKLQSHVLFHSPILRPNLQDGLNMELLSTHRKEPKCCLATPLSRVTLILILPS